MSELLGVLFKILIAVVLAAAVVVFGSSLMGKGSAGNHASDLVSIATNLKTLYSAQPTFGSVSNAAASRYAPEKMKAGGTNLINPWGGAVTVSPNTNNVMMDIKTVLVPDSDCASLATTVSGYKSLKVNSVTFGGSGSVDAGDVSAACGTDGTDVNQLTFTFGK